MHEDAEGVVDKEEVWRGDLQARFPKDTTTEFDSSRHMPRSGTQIQVERKGPAQFTVSPLASATVRLAQWLFSGICALDGREYAHCAKLSHTTHGEHT